jgi:hypothetical protein
LSISCWSLRAAIVTAGRRRGVFGVQPYLVQMRCVAAVGGLEAVRSVLVGSSRQTRAMFCATEGLRAVRWLWRVFRVASDGRV